MCPPEVFPGLVPGAGELPTADTGPEACRLAAVLTGPPAPKPPVTGLPPRRPFVPEPVVTSDGPAAARGISLLGTVVPQAAAARAAIASADMSFQRHPSATRQPANHASVKGPPVVSFDGR